MVPGSNIENLVIYIAFTLCTIFVWIATNHLLSLIPFGNSQDEKPEFDMTVEMSNSCQYTLQLIVTGIVSVTATLGGFIYCGLI